MLLTIIKQSSLQQLQEDFNRAYPFLKIELSKAAAGLPETKQPALLQNYDAAVHININRHQTVANLENEFLAKTKLHIRLYRRFCNVWIETLLTDDWTLEQQNTEGELLSRLNQNPLPNSAGVAAALTY